MPERAEQERDQGAHVPAQVRPAGAVDVPAQEMMDGDVPLAAELEPVARVPPVAVEVAVGEAGDLGEGAKHVLEDDEEDEEEGDHEGEEEQGDGFRHDEQSFGRRGDAVEADGGVVQDGNDEFFARDGEEEDAAEDGEGFPEQLEVLRPFGAGVFELVAEGGDEDVIGVVGPGQVLRVGDLAEGRGEFEREVLAKLRKGFFFVLMRLFLLAHIEFVRVGTRPWIADCCCSGGAFGVV